MMEEHEGLHGASRPLTSTGKSLHSQYGSVAMLTDGATALADPLADPTETPEEEDASSEGFSCTKASRVQIFTFVCIALNNFIAFCSYSIVTPFFPGEALQRGASQLTVGFIIGIYAIVGLVAGPFFGKYLTSIGSRFMLISGLLLSGGCTVLFGFLQYTDGTTFIILCFAIRSIDALAVSASNTAGTAILTHAFPNNVATVMGTLEIFTGLGLMAGPPIGGFLYDAGGFKLPFLVVGGVLLCCGVCLWVLVPPQPDENEGEKKTGSLLSLLKLPVIIFTCGLGVVMASTISFLDPVLQPYLAKKYKYLTPTHMGLIFLLFSSVYAILAPLWGWMADKKKAMRFMMITGLVILTASTVMIGPSPLLTDYLNVLPKNKLWMNIVGLATLALGCGVAVSPIFNEMLCAASDAGMEDSFATNGLVSGLFNAGFSIGEFIGPTASSALVQKFGFPWATTALGGFTLSYAAVMVIFYICDYCCCAKRRHEGPSTEEENQRLLVN
ncbi:MFS-type transporter SLC18B1-like isoform X1 [Branchiostoma lanceolatum]|uniref:MFS-type transporter SLC18B1-like isoform X1 n=1 Tax=Branchiostoma lanceolatum TaxID=7740 RepID=UPI003452EC1C